MNVIIQLFHFVHYVKVCISCMLFCSYFVCSNIPAQICQSESTSTNANCQIFQRNMDASNFAKIVQNLFF